MANFWNGFSQSFFTQAQNAIQNERNRAADQRDQERFNYQKEQWQQAKEDRQAGLDFADKVQNGTPAQQISFDPAGQGMQMPYGGTTPTDSQEPLGVRSKGLQAPQAAQPQQGFAPETYDAGGVMGMKARPDTSLLERKRLSADEVTAGAAGLAFRKGDYAAGATLNSTAEAQKRSRVYDEAFVSAGEKWSSLSDDEKSDYISKASYDRGIKGFGSWVAGKGKQQGYMNYLPPSGDPIKLSGREAQELFQISAAMGADPARGRQEIEKTSDKVRAVLAQEFDAQSKGATVSNTAAHYANTDANSAARLGLEQRKFNADQNGLAAPVMIVNRKTGEIGLWSRPKNGTPGVETAPEGYSFVKDRQGPTTIQLEAYKRRSDELTAIRGLEKKDPKEYKNQVAAINARYAPQLAQFDGEGTGSGGLPSWDTTAPKPATAPVAAPQAQEAPAGAPAKLGLKGNQIPQEYQIKIIRGQGAAFMGRMYPTYAQAEQAQNDMAREIALGAAAKQDSGAAFNNSRGGLRPVPGYNLDQYTSPTMGY